VARGDRQACRVQRRPLDRVAAEPRSKVSFEIEELGQLAKLTVAHDDLEPGSAVLESISQGWPHILSNLKTLLETGETLPATPPPDSQPATASRS
jgi:hypothetical protein